MKQLLIALLVALNFSSCGEKEMQNQSEEGTLTGTDSLYTIYTHGLSLTVDSKIGGRITSLKKGGTELLSGPDVHPVFYGSSLWLSPEGKWGGHGILDRGEYSVDFHNNERLRVVSQVDTARGFSFTKEFSSSSFDTSFAITYTITNINEEIQEVAPWEVTRVPTGGLAFFPKGTEPPLPKSNLTRRESEGMIWYPFDEFLEGWQKLFINGDEGWQAYVQDKIIFIKKFPQITPSEAAPGEENVEIYVNPSNTYIELENQGAYVSLKPNESLTYRVKWYVRDFPASIEAEVGNTQLITFARNVIATSKE